MNFTRPGIAIAGAALAGIALVGIGAGASFTDSTSSTQKVTAGQMNMVVWAAGTGCPNVTYGCKSLTLPDVGPVGSTFETPATHVFMTNQGSIPAFFSAIQMTETNDASAASLALRNEMNVCVKSTDPSGTWVEGNGPLTTALGLHPSVGQNPVQINPGQTMEYWVSFYAGKDSTGCGTTTSDGPTTSARWVGYQGHAYITPASLNDDAQGGSDSVTLTFSYTG